MNRFIPNLISIVIVVRGPSVRYNQVILYNVIPSITSKVNMGAKVSIIYPIGTNDHMHSEVR